MLRVLHLDLTPPPLGNQPQTLYLLLPRIAAFNL